MPIQNGKYVSPAWKNNAPPTQCEQSERYSIGA